MRRPPESGRLAAGPSPAAMLMGVPAPLAAEILGPAIAAAEAGELAGLAAAAVPVGPAALAACLARLGEPGLEPGTAAGADLESALAAARGLVAAAGLAVGRGLGASAASRLVRLLEVRPEPGAGGLLAGLAGEPDRAGDEAAAALRRWAAAGGDRRGGPAEASLAAAAWRASRRTDLLLALALMAGRGTPIAASDDDPALAIALGSVLQRCGPAGVRLAEPRLVGWLAAPAVRRTAQRALGDRRAPEAASRVLAGGHLAELPAVRAGLAGVSRPGRAIPVGEPVAALPPRAARGLARLVVRLPVAAPLRRCTLAGLASHDDAAAAWRAVGRLAQEPVRRVGEDLARIAVGRREAAARLAARRLREAGGSEALERVLASRGPAGVARAARRRIDGPERRAAGRTDAWRRAVRLAELARDREAVVGRWRAALVSGDARARCEAIAEIDRAGFVGTLSSAVAAVTGDPDPRVAAAACRALRWARDPDVAEVLVAAGAHADPAVRTAAMESLGRRGRVPLDRLVAAARSGDAAERAAAALGLAELDERRAGRLLGTMLMDARPAHRIAGATAARRLRMRRLLPVLAEVARRDRDAEVRRHARAAWASLRLRGSAELAGGAEAGASSAEAGGRSRWIERGAAVGGGRRARRATAAASVVSGTPDAGVPADATVPAEAASPSPSAAVAAFVPLPSVPAADPLAAAAGLEPTTAGMVAAATVLALAAVGGARALRRRLDPAERAERLVMDRAGVAAADRRALRRAARRLDPPVPAASLLLARGLLDDAADAPRTPPTDAARLRALAERRFGRRPDAAASPPVETTHPRLPRPARSAAGRGLATGDVAAAPSAAAAGRARAAALLAVAMEAAETRRRATPVVAGRPGDREDDSPPRPAG